MNEEQLISTVVTTVEKTMNESNMSLKLAMLLIDKVKSKAQEEGLSVVVAVSDRAGHPVAIECMDGAYYGSFDIALNKAYTCISFKMATKELAKLAQPGQELYGIQYTNEGKIVIFGGGVPLLWNNKIIGALGVSGGTAAQDTRLADYGQSVLKEVITCR